MPRVTAPITTFYLADQLSTVLAFAERFCMHTPRHAHAATQICNLLTFIIRAWSEPDKYASPPVLDFLQCCDRQIRVIHDHNPSLQDKPGYQHAYEASLNTLTQVTHLAILHNLLTELEDEDQ
jgi:hypothetical protein